MTNKQIFPHPLSAHNLIVDIRGTVGLYMETGVLDLLQIAPLNADSYRAAQLYFNAELSAYAVTDEALMGKISVSDGLSITYDPELEEGQSKTGVGYKKSEMTFKAIGTFSGTFVDTTETFYSDTKEFRQSAQNRKEAQIYFPASTFSGKMRQYVQSIYGSKRTDYSYNDPVTGKKIAGSITIDGKSYSPYFSNSSHWIYTTDEYEYFLLSMSSSGITVTKMEPSTPGKRLRSWVKATSPNNTDKRRAEGYILSTVERGDSATVTSDVSPAFDHGSPAIYGWHFNMDGDEGHVVAIKQVDSHSAEATHLKMTVSLDTSERDKDVEYWQDSGNWSFSVSIVEGPTEFTLAMDDILWKPDVFSSGMNRLVVSEPEDPMIDADVPVYVVYDYDGGGFDLIRHERDSTVTDVGKNVAKSSYVGTLASENGCNYYTSATGASFRGFYVEGGDAHAQAYDAASVSGNAVEVRLGSFIGCPGPYFLCFGGGASYNGEFSFISHCTIPFGDMDAIFLGGKLHFEGDMDWLNGTLGGTQHTHIGWDDCEDGAPTGSGHTVDWINPFFPSSQEDGHFRTRLLNTGLSGGTAEQGDVTGLGWDAIWITYWYNGGLVKIHEQQRSSDAGGTANGVYMPSCLQLRPFTDIAEDGAGYPEEPLDYGGWVNHFREIGQGDPDFNANAVFSKTNLTGDYFITNLDGTDAWSTNSYGELEETNYISFVGHD